MSARYPVLSLGLVVLAGVLAVNALLGPVGIGVLEYHDGTTMTNQGIGLDFVTLLLAVPLALAAAILIARGHPGGPVLASRRRPSPPPWHPST